MASAAGGGGIALGAVAAYGLMVIGLAAGLTGLFKALAVALGLPVAVVVVCVGVM